VLPASEATGPLRSYVFFTVVSQLNEAVQVLSRWHIDAIVAEFDLRESRDYMAFRALSTAAPDTPLLVISTPDTEATAMTAFRLGADECVSADHADAVLLETAIRRAIERHAYYAELRTSESRYRSLVEATVQGIVIHVNGVIEFANRALADLVGVDDPKQLIGRLVWDFIASEDLAAIAGYARARMEGRDAPARYEFRLRRQDNRIRWVDCSVRVLPRDGELTVMVSLFDITDRKLADEHLKASEERFRLLANNIKEAFIIMEIPSGKALYLSPVWEEIWGRPVEDAYADSELWFDAIDAHDRASVRRHVEALNDGRESTNIFRVHRPDGSTCCVRARLFPVRDEGNQVYRVVGLIEDITAIRQTEEQLRQSQKMEAIGRLAGGIAHDFNNLLVAIGGYAEIIAEELGPSHHLRKDADEILSAARSAAGLTQQLLAFSRRQILQPQILDLNQVLRRVQQLLRRIIGEDVSLAMNLASTLDRVVTDPGQIEQVIMNLAVNARDAMPMGGRLIIETANVELDEAYVAQHRGAAAGKHVMIGVSDTGIGMDAATQKRLFEPFFTTKPVGRGTGLGLATVYGIVKQSNGSIWVYSESGKGSTFKIFLPAAASATDQPSEAGSANPLRVNGTETVLVVEDQLEVRTLIEDALRRRGFTVLQAASGEEALAIAHAHYGPIHLVLTDVVLPGAGGRTVARDVVRIRPDVRVVYMSGYTDDAIVHHGVLEPGLAFIQKPFSGDAIARTVRAVLDAKQGPPV
jgi:two-component system cell cycle sensor histidine kinase/response regulator CckA